MEKKFTLDQTREIQEKTEDIIINHLDSFGQFRLKDIIKYIFVVYKSKVKPYSEFTKSELLDLIKESSFEELHSYGKSDDEISENKKELYNHAVVLISEVMCRIIDDPTYPEKINASKIIASETRDIKSANGIDFKLTYEITCRERAALNYDVFKHYFIESYEKEMPYIDRKFIINYLGHVYIKKCLPRLLAYKAYMLNDELRKKAIEYNADGAIICYDDITNEEVVIFLDNKSKKEIDALIDSIEFSYTYHSEPIRPKKSSDLYRQDYMHLIKTAAEQGGVVRLSNDLYLYIDDVYDSAYNPITVLLDYDSISSYEASNGVIESLINIINEQRKTIKYFRTVAKDCNYTDIQTGIIF